MAGLRTIIALSFVLAIGFLLCILSCALFGSYYPLLVVATFVIAPLPNFICEKTAGHDDFLSSDGGNSGSIIDFGRFMTGFLCVQGVALPALLAHSAYIRIGAMVMSICGGVLIYGTIISFTAFFKEEEEF